MGATSSTLTVKYGVPGSTVRNHKSKSSLRIGSGRPTLLTNIQEQYLVELLKNLEMIGVRLTKSVVMKLGSDYAQLITGKTITVGRKWLNKFLQRWKNELKIIKEEKIETSHRNGFTEDVRRGWFEKLEEILRTNNLTTRPHAIYNCDESGFSDETASEMVIVSHQTKHAYEQSGGSGKSFTTGLICGNAAGEVLPPFIIYSAKNLNPQWTFGGPPGSTFAVSESGWITTYLFSNWFKWFTQITKDVSKPILLLMDNHACHISIEVIEAAKENQILLLLLPPHCTHALQPLDTVTFGVAKQSWKRIVTKYFLRSGRKTIRKMDLPPLFSQLYASAFTPKQVVAGFSRAGIWPFDSHAMADKVARQPLTPKQINQLPQTTSTTDLRTSSTQGFLDTSDSTLVSTSSTSPSYLFSDIQHPSSLVHNLESSGNDDPMNISNENALLDLPTPMANDNPSVTIEFPSAASSSEIVELIQLLTGNRNCSTSPPSSSNPFDLLRFPSFTSKEDSNINSFNCFNSLFDESNNSTVPTDTRSSLNQIDQSVERFSNVPSTEVDSDAEDDGQIVIGFDRRTMAKTHGQYSRYSNNHQQRFISILDFEADENEETRKHVETTPLNKSIFTLESKALQADPLNLGPQVIHSAPLNQLSPSAAVRSIVADVFQQRLSTSSPTLKTNNKRVREEGKYGEEITSSNRLMELKEKNIKTNSKKRKSKSATSVNTTLTFSDNVDSTMTKARAKRRRLSKNTSDLISSSQATRAVATLATSPTSNTSVDLNPFTSSFESDQ